MPKSWTKNEDQFLERSFDEGMSASQIGKALGRTRSMVLGRKFRLGLCHPPDSDCFVTSSGVSAKRGKVTLPALAFLEDAE